MDFAALPLTSFPVAGKPPACGDHFLPMSREEMRRLGWSQCDVILVSGDAYVDHPSFAAAILGRTLEHFGFRVGIIAQPDWRSCDDFRRLGPPRLLWGVSAGNMDSMVNHYTADRKIRHDDAYTPGNVSGRRPDRAAVVYAQRCREAYRGIPVAVGGIEASLRRCAHYDYWSDTVKRALIFDAKADILLYGSGERSLTELALRLHRGETISTIWNIRGSAVILRDPPPGIPGSDETRPGAETEIPPVILPEGSDPGEAAGEEPAIPEAPGQSPDPGAESPEAEAPAPSDPGDGTEGDPAGQGIRDGFPDDTSGRRYVLMPSFEDVREDRRLYAHSMHLLRRENNPFCASFLLQRHGDRGVWINPPPWPLGTPEMDLVYDLPFMRRPHPSYHETIPAYEMIKTSVTAMRGCFGGCAFCTIALHAGKFIQSRSPESIEREIAEISRRVPGYAGVITDVGGPSANMYRLGCRNRRAMGACRRGSCLYPNICRFLDTDQSPAVELYRRLRQNPHVRRLFISSGIRLELALCWPDYIREVALHHVSGHLKVAPEHMSDRVLGHMHKPGALSYRDFERIFLRCSQEAGRRQVMIPYFIASHPGTEDEDMISLALWLKERGLQVDQVQSFYPTPLSDSTTMYWTGFDPMLKIKDNSPVVPCVRGEIRRRIQKAILRYHDPENWDIIRKRLRELGLERLIGTGSGCLVPPEDRRDRRRGAAGLGAGDGRGRSSQQRPERRAWSRGSEQRKDRGTAGRGQRR